MFLDIDGNKVFALSFGRGPMTFLAHSGWVGNVEDWIATLAPLSESWRTVTYDHRGTGETQVAVDKISAEALVDDVFRVMDALQIDKCVLAGFSRGTVTALRAVLRDSGRFEGLVLMNGYGEIKKPGMTFPPRVPPSKWPGETFHDHLTWFADRCLPEPESDHIRRWAVNILSRSTPEAADRLFTIEAAQQIDWPAKLAELKLPTLLIHGEKDALYSTDGMEYAQSIIPNSKLVILDGSGHLPAMVRPFDVAKVIDDFFAERLNSGSA